MNTAQEYIPTRRERLGWRLFPSRHCDMPKGMGFRDGIITEVTVGLSFADRVRALFSGRIRVVSKTATGNLVGHYETNAVAHVEPPKLFRS